MLFKKITITTSFICLLYSFNAFSIVRTLSENESDTSKSNIFELKHKLQEQNRQIQSWSKEVNSIEINLGLNNKKYLALASERAKIEEGLANAKRNADFNNENLKKHYEQTKNILMGMLLNKLENMESASGILAKKILTRKLHERLADLDGMMKTNKISQGDVDNLQQKLQDSMSMEKDLLAMMGELEVKKRDLRDILSRESKDNTESKIKFDEEKNKLAIRKNSQKQLKIRENLAVMQITEEIKIPSQPSDGSKYYPPILNYHGIEYQKKGVTFNFQGKNEVHATKAGKVVYTGPLANYGNVLMINHGNDTRTILLGQFDYAVKTGDEVKEAQIVGYTHAKSDKSIGEGRIYFEVRKNNLAQNTYLLLDKKLLANNSSN